MNILPKKRWHVRTKDNIARVRKDEAEAKKKDEERLEKLKFAESEARINFLRRQTGLPERQRNLPEDIKTTTTNNDCEISSSHIDLFSDYKTHVKTTNKDLEKEQKEEREKYEKQIGYLTYLGQDTNEALKLRSWYEVAPKRHKTERTEEETEKDFKNKFTQDPLTLINALLPSEKRFKASTKESTTKPTTISNEIATIKEEESPPKPLEHKKHRKKEKKSKRKKLKKERKTKRDKSKKNSHNHLRHPKKQKSIEKDLFSIEQKRREQKQNLIHRLRKERLQREAEERDRQDALLKPPDVKTPPAEQKKAEAPRIVQKYNSQFNPELAKQNML